MRPKLRSIWIAALLIISLGGLSTAASDDIQISQYDIHVQFDSLRQGLEVRSNVTIGLAVPEDSLRLTFSSTVAAVTIRDLSGSVKEELVHQWTGKDSLLVVLPPALANQPSVNLSFSYRYQLPGSNQQVIMLDRGYRWYPMLLDNVATVRLTADLPDSLIAFAAGDLTVTPTTAGMNQFNWETRIPIFKIALVVAPAEMYRRYVRNIDSIEVQLYTATSDSGWQSVCDEAAKELAWYNQTIGRYPHRTFTIVEAPEMPGSNIATSLVMMGSEMLKPCLKNQFDGMELVIAAQWFGAGMFGKFLQPGFWFTTLSMPHHARFLYQRAIYGEERYRRALEQPMAKYREFAGSDKDISILNVDFLTSMEKGTVIYAKGPFLLESARATTGDDGWMRFLGTLWKNYKGKTVTIDQTLMLLEAESKDSAEQLRRELGETGIPDQK